MSLMKAYPTVEGIAVSIDRIELPESILDIWEPGYYNNHHNEWSFRRMGRSGITLALRNLNRHQFVLPTDIHEQLHKIYGPPDVPTLRQAAREVIDAYDKSEPFKLYDPETGDYYYEPIPRVFVDKLVSEHGLCIVDLCR